MFLFACLGARRGEAQLRLQPQAASFWATSATLVAGSALLDHTMWRFMERHETATLDRLALDVDPLGRARYIIPALIVSAGVTRIAGRRSLSDAVVRVGLGYAAADGIASLLKPVVGRHRPDSTGRPLQFRPFHVRDRWDSFPSQHAVHALALAAGIADQADRPWISALAYGAAATVSLQRIYTRAHWTSDVAVSAVLAVSASLTTIRWLERGGLGGVLRRPRPTRR